MPSVHTNRGTKRARTARAELGLDPLRPVACVLSCVEEAVGIPVAAWDMGDDALAGAFVRRGAGRVIFVNGAQAAVRVRFTLAHELGHAWIGHDSSEGIESYAALHGRDPREVEANAFAAEFLVPRCAMEELLADRARPTLEELVVVARAYGVSAESVLYRMRTCELVEDTWADRLKGEIDERLHHRLGHDAPALEDRLSDLALPYLSPALAASRLADQLHAAVRL